MTPLIVFSPVSLKHITIDIGINDSNSNANNTTATNDEYVSVRYLGHIQACLQPLAAGGIEPYMNPYIAVLVARRGDRDSVGLEAMALRPRTEARARDLVRHIGELTTIRNRLEQVLDDFDDIQGPDYGLFAPPVPAMRMAIQRAIRDLDAIMLDMATWLDDYYDEFPRLQ